MKRSLRWGLLLLGVALLGLFVGRADWVGIRAVLGRLDAFAVVGLFPYLLVYLADTAGWAVMLPPQGRPRFWTLFRIRWAGEAVNNLVPTGYVGGEAVKVFLLARHGVSKGDATVAAVTSKTAQTLGQIAFIALGAALFARLAPADPAVRGAMFGVAGAGAIGVVLFLAVQRRGLAQGILAVLERLRLKVGWLDRRRGQLLRFDRETHAFYSQRQRDFFLGTLGFFAGWLLDAVEIFVVGRLLHVPVGIDQALAIEAFVGVAKILGLVVPGALGVQESGVVWLCRFAGLPENFGYTYALWRRARELLYAGFGWLLLIRQHARLADVRGAAGAARPGEA